MRKGLFSYTTKVDASKTIQEIQQLLGSHGAKSIMVNYGDAGRIDSLSFAIQVGDKQIGIRLPCHPKPVLKVLENQYRAGKVDRRYAQEDQALRVAWRIVFHWLEAQMAILETEMVKMEQIFLPYTIMRDGKTLFESFEDTGFKMLGGGDS